MGQLTQEQALSTWGRRSWGALDLLNVVATFAPETREAFKALGVRPSLSYFAARSAALGAASAELVTATFYVFAPALVGRAVPATWSVVGPEQVLEARYASAAATLHRLLDDGGPGFARDVDEAVALARTACAGLTLPGRPLFAAWASLPWPQEPLQQLWHAATLVREHRGDGHLAELLHAHLDPVEAMLTAGLAGPGLAFQKATRGWSEDDWQAGMDRLRSRGLVEGDVLSRSGRALRIDIEARTDIAASEGWRHLGVEGTERLAGLLRPWRQAVLDSGVLPESFLAR